MKEIVLCTGDRVLVDDADFADLNRWKWKLHPQGYASRTVTGGGTVLMHRQITAARSGVDVDHINRNKLDNRRENLRLVDHSTNMHNRPKQANNTSGLKGVSWDASRSKWKAAIQVRGQQVYLGRFLTKEDAHTAYLAACRSLVGDIEAAAGEACVA